MPYIASGVYGCTFAPSLKCDIPRKKGMIGKVMKSDYEEEIDAAELIQKIDPQGKFTVPYGGHCLTSPAEWEKSDGIEKCHFLDKHNDYHQLLFKYGGIDLNAVVNKKQLSVYADDFILMMVPLIEGIKKLQQYGYAHCDIKPANILFKADEKKLYLIDFGLMTNLSDLIFTDYILRHPYPYYPPEFKIMYLMSTDPSYLSNLSEASITDNFDSLKMGSKEFMDIFDEYIDMNNEIFDLINKVKNIHVNEYNKRFQSKYVFKADIYSLGITYADFCMHLMAKNKFSLRNKALYDEFMTNIWPHMVRIDADDRLDIDSLLKILKHIIGKTAPHPYLKSSASAKTASPPRQPKSASAKMPSPPKQPKSASAKMPSPPKQPKSVSAKMPSPPRQPKSVSAKMPSPPKQQRSASAKMPSPPRQQRSASPVPKQHKPSKPPRKLSHTKRPLTTESCLVHSNKELKRMIFKANVSKPNLCKCLLSKRTHSPHILPTTEMRKEDCLRLLRKEIVEKLRKHKLPVSGLNKDILCNRLLNNV